jgi:hypothetical protein
MTTLPKQSASANRRPASPFHGHGKFASNWEQHLKHSEAYEGK